MRMRMCAYIWIQDLYTHIYLPSILQLPRSSRHYTPHTYPDQTRKVPSVPNKHLPRSSTPFFPSCTPKPQMSRSRSIPSSLTIPPPGSHHHHHHHHHSIIPRTPQGYHLNHNTPKNPQSHPPHIIHHIHHNHNHNLCPKATTYCPVLSPKATTFYHILNTRTPTTRLPWIYLAIHLAIYPTRPHIPSPRVSRMGRVGCAVCVTSHSSRPRSC